MDRWVWQMFRDRQLRAEHFTDDNGRCQMNKTGRHLFYGFYESQAGSARRLLRRYGYTLAKRYQAAYETCNAAFVY
jgi:CRISPR-associated protein Cas1